MANEITALEGSRDNYTLFFLVPIATPIQVGGSNVIPTPADAGVDDLLPPVAAAVITQAERDALNAGTSMWVTRSFRIVDEAGLRLTNLQLQTRARELYAVAKVEELAAYNDRYEFSGIRIDEV